MAKQLTEMDKAYIAKFYEHDGRSLVAVALDRPGNSIGNLYAQMKKENKLSYYKRLWEKEVEKDD